MANIQDVLQQGLLGLGDRMSMQQTVDTTRQALKGRDVGRQLPRQQPPPPGPGGGFPSPGEIGGDGSEGTWTLVEGADGRMYERNSTTGEYRLAPAEFQPQQQTVGLREYGEIPLDSWDPRARLPAGSVTGPLGSSQVPVGSSAARAGALSGAVENPLDQWAVLAEAGLPDSLIRDLLFGDGGGGGGGGSPYAGLYADLALRQQEQAERQDRINNIAELVGLDLSRQQEDARRAEEVRAMIANLAPLMTGGRDYMGGFEPYGAYSAVANFAGVPFTPRPIVTTNVPVGYAPQTPSPYEDELRRQILGG